MSFVVHRPCMVVMLMMAFSCILPSEARDKLLGENNVYLEKKEPDVIATTPIVEVSEASLSSTNNTNMTVSDFLIVKKPPPTVDVVVGHDLQLFIIFSVITVSGHPEGEEFIFYMQRPSEEPQALYKCTDHTVNGERVLDCYCYACAESKSNKLRRLRAERRMYIMKRDQLIELEMVVNRLEEIDNGTIFTLTMENEVLYETKVRCTREQVFNRFNRLVHCIVGVILGLTFILTIICIVSFVWKQSARPSRTRRRANVTDPSKTLPPSYSQLNTATPNTQEGRMVTV